MEAMQSMLWPATVEAFPDTHLMACDLRCSGATAAWRAILIILHEVTVSLTTSCGLEILMPILRARRTAGMVVYSTVL